MRATHDEAERLLRKWEDEGTSLACRCFFSGLTARLRGRLSALSGFGLTFSSEDRLSEVRVRFDKVVDFQFGDLESRGRGFGEALVLFFRIGEVRDDADYLILSQILTQSEGVGL